MTPMRVLQICGPLQPRQSASSTLRWFHTHCHVQQRVPPEKRLKAQSATNGKDATLSVYINAEPACAVKKPRSVVVETPNGRDIQGESQQSLLHLQHDFNINGSISVQEFKDMLSVVTFPDLLPQRIALAISGGVDSMALVHLAREYNTTFSPITLKAFIVDHAARPGSAAEATLVASRIQSEFDISAEVLTMKWSTTSELQGEDLATFERDARKKRYNLLAEAVLKTWPDENKKYLVTAHHADDQAETVLMRLMSGSGRSGLAGMRVRAAVPECYDVKGANTIHLLRPLISVPKKRLIATLESRCIAWHEDETNSDPTLTKRNAIRALFASPHWPQALRPVSICRTGAHIAAHNDTQKLKAYNFLDLGTAKYDNASGSLTFTIRDDLASLTNEVLSLALSVLASKVTHKTIPILGKDMLPIVRLLRDSADNRNWSQWRRTSAGILLEFQSAKKDPGRWRIAVSRQPFTRRDSREDAPLPKEFMILTLSDLNSGEGRWILWDNRFWIHTKPMAQMYLRELAKEEKSEYWDHEHSNILLPMIRPCKPMDVVKCMVKNPQSDLKRKKSVFMTGGASIPGIRPGRIKHHFHSSFVEGTLPVVMWQTSHEGWTVIGLPTLGAWGNSVTVERDWVWESVMDQKIKDDPGDVLRLKEKRHQEQYFEKMYFEHSN